MVTFSLLVACLMLSNRMATSGLSEELLSEIFMDEEAEQQLTTYEKV
jgi:hypothetical protein